eukprot:CAMPEP_0119477382 /NCGR_PEP_ID=MMETSP1344-20130328/7541_1 /TAXON_ID=236787 /ORGANISM="Florenciella parvula, Strain CCMP2471" /LENGTH=44 /DNA_ID= /DNA_START= /DNA_END= /DNA_ORIENTATION=
MIAAEVGMGGGVGVRRLGRPAARHQDPFFQHRQAMIGGVFVTSA